MHDLLLGFLVACALCAVLVWVVTASHHRMMVMVAKQRTSYRLMDGKFYYLVEESEYLELQKAATTSDHANYFVPGSSPARNRRVTDAWMHDPVPSESGFKRQGVANHEPVGWNDDY
jgi:hypothetical protein